MNPCTKRAFADPKLARQALARMRRRGYRGIVYACKHCGMIHLGRKRKETRNGEGAVRV